MNVHEPKTVSLPDEEYDHHDIAEANIYAISSEGGNLIFHVNHNRLVCCDFNYTVLCLIYQLTLAELFQLHV